MTIEEMQKRVDTIFSEAAKRRSYWVLDSQMQFTEALLGRAAEMNLTGRALADKLGVTQYKLNQILDDASSTTIEQASRLAFSLGASLEIKLKPLPK